METDRFMSIVYIVASFVFGGLICGCLIMSKIEQSAVDAGVAEYIYTGEGSRAEAIFTWKVCDHE